MWDMPLSSLYYLDVYGSYTLNNFKDEFLQQNGFFQKEKKKKRSLLIFYYPQKNSYNL